MNEQDPTKPKVTGQKIPGQEIIVTVQDLRAAKLCFQGARPWLARHGLSWQEFLANGIEAETLEATGDALALRVIAQARARMVREGNRDG